MRESGAKITKLELDDKLKTTWTNSNVCHRAFPLPLHLGKKFWKCVNLKLPSVFLLERRPATSTRCGGAGKFFFRGGGEDFEDWKRLLELANAISHSTFLFLLFDLSSLSPLSIHLHREDKGRLSFHAGKRCGHITWKMQRWRNLPMMVVGLKKNLIVYFSYGHFKNVFLIFSYLKK